MPRDVRLYLSDIREASKELIVLFEDEATPKKLRELACLHLLQILGEAAKNIPKDVRQSSPAIPWRQMCGLRDVIVHEYFQIDFSQLQSLKRDLPTILLELEKLMTDRGTESEFK